MATQDNNEDKVDLQGAIDRSDRELGVIANFYYQHGYTECAQDIYRTMFKLRADRNMLDERAADESEKSLSDLSEEQSGSKTEGAFEDKSDEQRN